MNNEDHNSYKLCGRYIGILEIMNNEDHNSYKLCGRYIGILEIMNNEDHNSYKEALNNATSEMIKY